MLKNYGIVTRAVKGIFSDIDDGITGFLTSFDCLQNEFEQLSGISIETSVLRVADKLEDIGASTQILNFCCNTAYRSIDTKIDLLAMKHAKDAGIRSDRACLPGTRAQVLQDISDWVNGSDVPRVLFLYGEAGTGKSAIGHSIGRQFESIGRLGAFFCCNRDFVSERGPETILITLAHDMAFMEPAFRRSLLETIHNNPSLSETSDIKLQWEKLIVEPARSVATSLPILMIIDAFDECGTRTNNKSRETLLSLVTQHAYQLPPNVRLLVTTRPENDVMEALDDINGQYVSTIAMSKLLATKSDIIQYINHRMTINSRGRNLLNDEQIEILTDRSEEYFLWAYIACETLFGQTKGGLSVSERFAVVISHSPEHGSSHPLDKLYTFILSEALDSNHPRVMKRYRSVMGQILAVFEPLSMESLNEIRKRGKLSDEDEISLIVPFIGSLFTGINNSIDTVRPVHASVRDFLVDRNRSGRFCVQPEVEQSTIAMGCLRLLNEKLQFNMCKLESSYTRNQDVDNLSEKISESISPALSYACHFWGLHVRETKTCQEFELINVHEMNVFFQEKLLFWCEVVSLTNGLRIAIDTIMAAHEWLNANVSHSMLKCIYII